MNHITKGVGIMRQGCGFKLIMYAWLIVINLRVGTKNLCGGDGRFKCTRAEEEMIEVIG